MFKSIRWVLLIYGLLCAFFYRYQQHFFFRPAVLERNHKYEFVKGVQYTEAKIPFDSATVIDVVQFHPKDSAKGVVLFFHGNRRNVEHYSRYAPWFTNKGYECWMPDYPGYGRSTGELDVDILQQLSIQLYKMAKARYKPEQIIIYGKSLGTGIAAYLASQRNCRQVILETPYYSLSSLASEYLFFAPVHQMIKYNLDTYQYFDKIDAPVTIMHGDKDALIPLTNAASLLPFMKPGDAFYVFKGGNHTNLASFPLYKQVVDSLLAK